MLKQTCLGLGGVTFLLLSGAPAAAPAGGSSGLSWQLDVTFHDPQRVVLRLPGDEHVTTFCYMLYQVTNNTGREVEFYPSFRLVTDTFQVTEGGADISPSVYDAIAARHTREFPFLAAPARVAGRLLQGEENARASVAIFRMFDKKASSFTVYGGGFSGAIRRVANPAFLDSQQESEDNPRFFVLRRTLAIVYELPGDPETRWQATPVRRTRKWVMR
jgi:hypothetical protein